MPFFYHQGHRLFYREHGAGRLLLILPGNTSSSVWHQGELEYFRRAADHFLEDLSHDLAKSTEA